MVTPKTGTEDAPQEELASADPVTDGVMPLPPVVAEGQDVEAEAPPQPQKRGLWARASEWAKSRLHTFVRRPFLWGVILLCISIIMKDRLPLFMGDQYFVLFLKELGFALIIAFFIAEGIERVARSQHNREVLHQMNEIKRNVFKAIFQRNHDRRMVETVTERILNYKFYRRKSKCTFSFEPVQPPEGTRKKTGLYRLTVKAEFTVVNISDSDADYVYEAFIEKHEEDGGAGELEITRMTRLELGSKVYDEEDLKQADCNYKDTKEDRRYSTITTIAGHKSLDVIAEFELIKRELDEITWRQVEPCDGFEVVMIMPEDLKAHGVPIHWKNDIPLVEKAPNYYTLAIDEPLFPYNGVALWWKPKSQG